MPEEMQRINPTSLDAYNYEGPGIGAGAEPIVWMGLNMGVSLENSHNVLEIGFGEGKLLQKASTITAGKVVGLEIAKACFALHLEEKPNIEIRGMDVSHDVIPYPDDFFDLAFCTETIEHLANPYFCIAEIKRVLRPDRYFILSFPMPEDNFGTGGGQHWHVYPGFLTKGSFELFMRSMYFRKLAYKQNGSSAWYGYQNIKNDPRMVDLFHVISGNYEQETLWEWVDKVEDKLICTGKD